MAARSRIAPRLPDERGWTEAHYARRDTLRDEKGVVAAETSPSQSKKGSGLGISIALEIVALNNGTLDFGPSEHGGLRIALRLPLAE